MMVGARLGEGDGLEFASFDMRGGPDDFLHGEFRCDPWAARTRAARGARHAELQPEALALLGGVFDQIEPMRREHAGVTRCSVGQSALPDIGNMGTLEADGFHGLEVFRDALLGDFVIHPMPPSARARGVGRIEKISPQRGIRSTKAGEWQEREGEKECGFFHEFL